MDLTLSLICQVSETAENSLSMVTCSTVKGLGLGWTQPERKVVQGHQNRVECPLTESALSLILKERRWDRSL